MRGAIGRMRPGRLTQEDVGAGLFVWRRYHPTPAPERGLMYGPSDTWTRLAAASSPLGGELDDFTDIFDVRPWTDGEQVRFGALSVLPRLVTHPTESYGLRITDPSEIGRAHV